MLSVKFIFSIFLILIIFLISIEMSESQKVGQKCGPNGKCSRRNGRCFKGTCRVFGTEGNFNVRCKKGSDCFFSKSRGEGIVECEDGDCRKKECTDMNQIARREYNYTSKSYYNIPCCNGKGLDKNDYCLRQEEGEGCDKKDSKSFTTTRKQTTEIELTQNCKRGLFCNKTGFCEKSPKKY